MIDIGRIAYQRYVETLDSLPYHESSQPRWEVLGKRGQDAWRHAACAVLDYIDECKKQMEESPDIEG